VNVGADVLGASAIPGDPAGLMTLAAQLQNAASDVTSVQERVAANGLQASWTGTAAETFRVSLNRFPGELTKVAAAFGDAAGSINAFARTLTELQTSAGQYETQISDLRVDLRAAQVRQDAASTSVAEARLAHSMATDPFSLHTAASALDLGLSFEREAVAEVEEIGAEITRFFQLAAANRTAYDNAVRVCCAALGVAYDAGSGSFGAWAERHAKSMAGLLAGGWGAVAGLGSRLGHDEESSVARVAHDAGKATDAMAHAAAKVAGGAYHFVAAAGYATGGDLYDFWQNPSWSNAKLVLGDFGKDAFCVGAGVAVVLGAATGVDELTGAGAVGAADTEFGTGILQVLGRGQIVADLAQTGGDIIQTADGHETLAQRAENVGVDSEHDLFDAAESYIPGSHYVVSTVAGAGTTLAEDKLDPMVAAGARYVTTHPLLVEDPGPLFTLNIRALLPTSP
jgi:uncharacterized protein YukE